MKKSVQRHILIHAVNQVGAGPVAVVLLFVNVGSLPALAIDPTSQNPPALLSDSTIRLVAKTRSDQYQAFCSGLSLGDGNVLTAGRCFQHPAIQDHLDRGEVYAQFHQPLPKFKQHLELIQVQGVRGLSTNGSDIAMLKLAEPPAGKETIPFAFGNCDNTKRIAIGFGMNKNGRPKTAPTMSQLTDTAAPGAYTPDGYPIFPDEKWLTLKGQTTNCPGDSGGPIFCQSSGKWAVTGVIPQFETNKPTGSGETVHRSCQTLPTMTAAKVSGQMHRLNSWRDLQPTPFRKTASRSTGRD